MTSASMADQVLAALDPEQREVAANPLGPMCVLAGAGTGKTRAITHRIAYGVHSGAYGPHHLLAVTFTARAAGEMRTRLRTLGLVGVQARTFHSAALRQLRHFWPMAIGGPAPEVIAHKGSVVAEAAARLHLQLDRTVVRDLAGEIEWAKVSMLTPDTYRAAAARAGRTPGDLDLTAMARLWQTYEEVKAARSVIDFEDVLLLMTGIMVDNDQVARTIREQYRHFVVDEYQDVNLVQQALLGQWLGERTDLCVVGDPAQTIYSFTGASAEHLLRFSSTFPDARTVRLVRNYRSTPQIIALANTVLAAGSDRRNNVQLQAQSPAGPAPRVREFSDDQAEATGVAERIAELIREGAAPSGIAVLFRINAQSEAIEQALSEHDIPYLVRGGERFFERPEIKNSLVLLRGAARSDDGSEPLGSLVRDVLTAAGWAPQRPSSGAMLDRWQSVNALCLLADDLAQSTPEARVRDFVGELDRRIGEQHAPQVEGVTLASLHAAKGLEWDAVFLVGASDGLIPIQHAEGPAGIEEERRLLYVGLTRARRHLEISWAASRNPGGRATRRLSRFLLPAAQSLGVPARAASAPRNARGRRPRQVVATARCRSCGGELNSAAEKKIGRCIDCPATYDEAVLESLKTWRLEVARTRKQPAFVIFTDATLVALAETMPGDERALVSIPGIGPAKVNSFGAAVLAVLHGADPLVEAQSLPGPEPKK